MKLQSVSSRLPWAVENVIENNHIHDCGVIDNFGAAIHFHTLNTRGNIVAHNHIHDQPHHAIYFSMGFGQNIIKYNDLHDLCYVMADAGGVYCNRWSILTDDPLLNRSQIIRYNRIQNVMGVVPHATATDDPVGTPSQDRIKRPDFTWGIYFDKLPRRVQVYGNLCAGNVWGGILLSGGYAEPEDCLVENKIFLDSSVYQYDDSMNADSRGNVFQRNIVGFSRPDASLLRVTSREGIKRLDENLYFLRGHGPLKVAGFEAGSFEKWRAAGFDRNSVIADPLFVNVDQGDYRLRPESPAWKLGFKPIPFEKIGIQKKQ